jgi:hypothetical protein
MGKGAEDTPGASPSLKGGLPPKAGRWAEHPPKAPMRPMPKANARKEPLKGAGDCAIITGRPISVSKSRAKRGPAGEEWEKREDKGRSFLPLKRPPMQRIAST